MQSHRILAINPGATSTKFSVYDNEKLVIEKSIPHFGKELEVFTTVNEQRDYRLHLILKELDIAGISIDSLNAVVGRGGQTLRPLTSGIYSVNRRMLEDLTLALRGEHASNLGGILAEEIAKMNKIPAWIVDPVAVDEMEEIARISGLPELPRYSMSHALNSKAVARRASEALGKKYNDVNLIVAHLGTGISVSPHHNGKMIDVNNALEEGPFALDRCGGLPARSLVKLCFSGKYTEKEIISKMFGSGGVYAFLGTKDLREVEKLINNGDKKAELIMQAMAYQVSKEIGAMSTVLLGNVDAIVLTGGMANSVRFIDEITSRVKYISKIMIFPGEDEMIALVQAGLRALNKLEDVKQY